MVEVKIKQEGINLISSTRAAQLSGYSQDYVGQLCRNGSIDCRRVLGEWRVNLESLLAYKKRFNPDFKPAKSIEEVSNTDAGAITAVKDGHTEIFTKKGVEYVSSAKASQLTGYTQDYVGQLARSDVLQAQKVGRKWFVNKEELLAHKKHNDELLASLQKESLGISNSSTAKVNSINIKKVDSTTNSTKVGSIIPPITYKRDDGSTIESLRPDTSLIDNTLNKGDTKGVSQIKVHDLRQLKNTRPSHSFRAISPNINTSGSPNIVLNDSSKSNLTDIKYNRSKSLQFIPKLIVTLELLCILLLFLQFNVLDITFIDYLRSRIGGSSTFNTLISNSFVTLILNIFSIKYLY